MCPLRTRSRPAAIMVTATGVPKHRAFGIRQPRLVAMMRAFSQTAGMPRRGLRLQRYRDKRPQQRKQQQKPGSNPLHVVQ